MKIKLTHHIDYRSDFSIIIITILLFPLKESFFTYVWWDNTDNLCSQKVKYLSSCQKHWAEVFYAMDPFFLLSFCLFEWDDVCAATWKCKWVVNWCRHSASCTHTFRTPFKLEILRLGKLGTQWLRDRPVEEGCHGLLRHVCGVVQPSRAAHREPWLCGPGD